MTSDDWQTVLTLVALNGTIIGFFTAIMFDYDRWIKIKWLRPIVYIILVPITGCGFLIYILFLNIYTGLLWLLIVLPIILLFYYWPF
jgi:hypothetical protein